MPTFIQCSFARYGVGLILTAILFGPALFDPAIAFGQSVEMKIHLPSEDDPDKLIEIPKDDIRITRFFNRARCECKSEFGVEFFVPNQESVPASRPIEIWLGNNCDDQVLQLQNCGPDPLLAFPDRKALDTKTVERIKINELADPINGQCGDREIQPRVYALVDTEDDGTYEVNDSIAVFLDLNPPPPLTAIDATASLESGNVKARGSEGGFIVTWKLPDSRQDDFEFFQVLCSKVDGSKALTSPSHVPLYETTRSVCNQSPEGQTGIEALDEAFICGEETVPGNSIRVSELSNAESYEVVLVAIDSARNPTAISLGTVTPQPVIDFWEDYQENGGDAVGGYCFVATAAYGDYSHPHVVVLREFRDRVMLTNPIGRALVATYYWASPPSPTSLPKATPCAGWSESFSPRLSPWPECGSLVVL